MALTIKRIARLTKAGRYGDGHGLYLQVVSPTNRSWLLRYERNGRGERWMGLGPIHTVNLQEARERARKARQLLLDGIDPLDARKAERAAQALEAARMITFEKAAQTYFDAHERGWRNAKYRAQFLSTLKTYAYPKIGNLPVAAIDTGLVLKVIEPIWGEITETANRVRGRIESVLDWATVRGYRTGDKMTRDCDCKGSGEDEETKKEETDLFVFDSKKAKDRHPPRTLAQMNQFLRDYYPRRRTTAAR